MFRGLLAVAAFILPMSIPVAATAETDKPMVAVLGLELIDDGSGLDQAAARYASELTGALRHRAALGKGEFTLAPNSNKDLLEMKLLNDCSTEARSCMAAIGRTLQADRLLYGKLEARDDGYQVSLKLLNVKSSAIERTLSQVISTGDATDDGLNNTARRLYNKLTGVPDYGAVQVEANVEGGTIYIDGDVRTTLSGGTAKVSGLTEGEHTLAVESPLHRPYEGTIVITGGEITRVTVTMARTMAGSSDGDDDRPGGAYRVMFWSSVLATGAAIGVFTVTGIQVWNAQDEKQSYFDTLEPQLRSDNIDLNGYERDANGDYKNVCTVGRDHQANYEAAQLLTDICDRGRSRATLTNIMIGASVATALAATYFYYKGYIQPDGGGSGAEPSTSEGPMVKILPTIGPETVGAGLVIEF